MAIKEPGTYYLDIDGRELCVLLETLGQASHLSERAQQRLRQFIESPDSAVTVSQHCSFPAPNTGETQVVLQPTEAFRRFVTAVQAGEL